MKISTPILFALALSAVMTMYADFSRAQTQSDLTFNSGGYLQLLCFTPIQFSVSQAALASIFSGGTGDDAITTPVGAISTSGGGGSLSGSATGLNTNLTGDPTALFGSFLGCGVAGAVRGQGATVSAALTASPHLTGPGSGRVLVDEVLVRENGSGNAYTNSFLIPRRELSTSSYTLIDTQIEFDFSEIDAAGTYSSGAGGSYVITVTAP